jgi:hypothetical protein
VGNPLDEPLSNIFDDVVPIIEIAAGGIPTQRRGVIEALHIQVGASGRPDVADLMRVIQHEGCPPRGGSRATWTWIRDVHPELVLLDVQVSRPVHCHLKLALSLKEHRGELLFLGLVDYLAISTNSVDDPGPVLPIHAPLTDAVLNHLVR